MHTQEHNIGKWFWHFKTKKYWAIHQSQALARRELTLYQEAFADDKIKLTIMMIFVFHRVEIIVGKWQNADDQYFLLFPQCYQKAFHSRLLKVGIIMHYTKHITLSQIHKVHFVNHSTAAWGKPVHGLAENQPITESFGPGQPAQTVQTDLGRYFMQEH